MIIVNGEAKIRVDYSVELDMTEEQWDSLSEKKQNEILDSAIDWMYACRSGEVDNIEVYDVIPKLEK